MHIDFCNGMYKGRSVAIDSQECINFYPEIEDATAKSRVILIGTPGTRLFTTIPGGTVRKLYASALGGRYAVVGNKFYSVNKDKTYQVLGNLNTDTGFVSISENAFQLMIADSSGGYVYFFSPQAAAVDTNGNTYTPAQFQNIEIEGYIAGSHVIVNSGFFIQNKNQSPEWIFSAFQDGLTWNPLWSYNAEGSADYVKAIATINNEIWTFGALASTVWYCTGGSTTDPQDLFARIPNAYFNIGCQAPASVVTVNNTVIWLGASPEGNNTVWLASNYLPQRISTHPIEYVISKLDKTDDAIAYTYQQEGHVFYVLTFPSGNRTFVHDLSTQLWHERGSWNKLTGMNDAYRGMTYAMWDGKSYVGDMLSGKIWELDLDVYNDDQGGEAIPITRLRAGGHIHADRQRLVFHEFEIDVQRGVGVQLDDDNMTQTLFGVDVKDALCADPQGCLQFSDDGGFAWSKELWSSVGRAGNYLPRLHWRRLGMSRDRVFRLKVSDPVKWIIIDARADIEKAGS